MSQESRAATVTSQLISFARVQLQLLDSDLNAFQIRAIKQAFAMQASTALQSYLEEIQVLAAGSTGKLLAANGFTATIRASLETAAGDFRARELKDILNDAESWLALLLYLREASMQAGEKESETKAKSLDNDNLESNNLESNNQESNNLDSNVIIAVAISDETSRQRWWEYSKQELGDALDQMQALISRQRENSVEE